MRNFLHSAHGKNFVQIQAEASVKNLRAVAAYFAEGKMG